MLQSKIGRNFIICFLVLNALLIGPFVYALVKRPGLMSNVLPGTFGGGMSPNLSGNMLFVAILLLVNALLFLVFGIGGTWHAMWAGLRTSPRKMRWLLHERTGLASDISGIVAAAVREEEIAEIAYLGRARGLLFAGLILFAAALPALCIAYTHAAPDSSPIFESAGQTIDNSAISQDTVLRFTADQLAGGLLLDIPEIFHLRATPVETNGANLLLGIVVLLYRTLIGFGVLLLYVGMRRAGALRAFAMETPLAAAEIVAMDPVFQDGHGYHDAHEHVDQAHEEQQHHHREIDEAPRDHRREEHDIVPDVHHAYADAHPVQDTAQDVRDAEGRPYDETHDGHAVHGHDEPAHGHEAHGHDMHDDQAHGHHVQAAMPSEELAEEAPADAVVAAEPEHAPQREPEYESS
jgi:hypothetical protein